MLIEHYLKYTLNLNVGPSNEILTTCGMFQSHLSIRFISWSPSPRRNRSRLADSIRQEHRASKRFSIISCSSAVDGLWRLNTWEGRQRESVLRKGRKLGQLYSCWIKKKTLTDRKCFSKMFAGKELTVSKQKRVGRYKQPIKCWWNTIIIEMW